jgi:hypothetical protein
MTKATKVATAAGATSIAIVGVNGGGSGGPSTSRQHLYWAASVVVMGPIPRYVSGVAHSNTLAGDSVTSRGWESSSCCQELSHPIS